MLSTNKNSFINSLESSLAIFLFLFYSQTLNAETEAAINIPLTLGGTFEIGEILDQLQIEAAFDEQVSDSLIDQVEEEVLDSVEDSVEDQLASDIEHSAIVGEELGIAAIADDVVSSLDGDIEHRAARFHSGHWLVMADLKAFQDLAKEGFVFDSFRELTSLGLILAEVSAPSSFNISTARQGVLDVVGAGRAEVDLNHYYMAGVSTPSSSSGVQPSTALDLPPGVDLLSLKVGVIDSMIDTMHPGLADSHIELADFTREGAKRPAEHGTAVASIIAASSQDYLGLAPKAEVFAASVFESQKRYGDTANTVSLVRALDWLLAKEVDVVNVSMAGPPNKLLELALKKFEERGVPVVAAAGNGGPASGPMFPAAYDQVIAVTAVDNQRKAFRLANRGSYVDLAAPGVDVKHLLPGEGYGTSSGTSFAVPFVSTAVAIVKHRFPEDDPAQVLFDSARDLGDPGKDDIYGYGLVTP